MKKFLPRALLAACVAILAALLVTPTFGQAEKIKQKAKDLKKDIESGKAPTNKPPQAPKPPPQAPKPPPTPKPPQTPQKPPPAPEKKSQ